jgi:hypothetical protein
MVNNTILTIDKCLEQVDLIDLYITKNIIKLIENANTYEFIKSNIFLLGITNKNNKNSLNVLIDTGRFDLIEKLINFQPLILDFKNYYENNLMKIILSYEYFYDFINKIIIDTNYGLSKDFIIKIITCKNNLQNDFIDNLIFLINSNKIFFYSNEKEEDSKKKLVIKILIIAKNIYLLDYEKKTLLINKLCRIIDDEDYLFDILKFININNFESYTDSNMLTCVDYLIINKYYRVLKYMLEKINYIEFTNIDDNLVYKLCDYDDLDIDTKTKLIVSIIKKSNITKFKNNKNQNIFFWLIEQYNIEKEIIMGFDKFINIYEQDIFGKSLFDIISEKYSNKDKIIIEKYFSKQYVDFRKFKKTNRKINIKSLLIKSDIGVFTSNIIHNMLYTIIILKSNSKILTIPYFKQSEEYKSKQLELINFSNNEKNILNYLKLAINYFNTWIPHLIIWKNKYNYWLDPNLIDFLIKNKKFNFIYIKLTVYLIDNSNTRHSNVIIVDNNNKIVERFEPYGEMVLTNSKEINYMIETQIANKINYKFIFTQPYPGFQSRSDEYAKFNKNYGDPLGFCLAWSFLYINIKMQLFKAKSNINPIDFINWYIINKFSKDFNIDDKVNKTNKYILFIRYYARYLDIEKNKLIKKFNLDYSLSYQEDIDIDYQNKLIYNINNELEKICF